MAFFTVFKQGQAYMNTWPLEAKLGIIFPENRVIKATQFAQKLMPFIAVFSILWQQFYAKADMLAFSLAILTALFALLLPLQGLYWLGKRSQQHLTTQSAVWFYEIYERLKKLHEPLPTIQEQPTYQHLALLLRQAQAKLGKGFWQEI